MKYTTHLSYILESMVLNKLTRGNNQVYTDEMDSIFMFENEKINNIIFKSLLGSEVDEVIKGFTKVFILRNLHREIRFQTYDIFRYTYLSEIMMNKDIIIKLNSEEVLLNQSRNNSRNNREGKSDNVSVNTSLPQNNVDTDFMTYEHDFADSTTHNHGKTSDSGESSQVFERFDLNNLIKIEKARENLYQKIERKLFKQVF